MKAKLVKESLNESSYSDFLMNYSEEIREAIQILKKLSKQYKNEKISDEIMLKSFNKLYGIYDKPNIDFIQGIIFRQEFHLDAEEIAKIGMEIQNRFGTEPRMVLNAIEDLNSNIEYLQMKNK
jgi:hypothetical protein